MRTIGSVRVTLSLSKGGAFRLVPSLRRAFARDVAVGPGVYPGLRAGAKSPRSFLAVGFPLLSLTRNALAYSMPTLAFEGSHFGSLDALAGKMKIPVSRCSTTSNAVERS
jgi:hypothetical protein